MAVSFLDLSRQNAPLHDELMKAVEEVLQSNAFILGPAVTRFEQHFAEQMRVKHAIGVNSGTDALLLTLHALGVQPGDEIICPAFGFVATADVIPRIGAQIVFVDVTEDFTIDADAVRAAITERTRAILPVHLYGKAAAVLALQQICTEFGIHMVEDVCQACGATLNGRALGTFGIAGCFSFYPTKNLGGFGDGGMVITDNDELAARLRLYRDHGRASDGRFMEVGYNSRLDAVQAALLDVMLPSLDEDNADRIANARFYDDHLNREVFTLPDPGPEDSHVYNLYTIRHPHRDQLRGFLKDRLVDTAVYYHRPLHLEPCFEYLGYQPGHFPVSEQLTSEVLSLPIAPGLTRQELEEVAHALDLFAQTHPAATTG
jgi:dTDP-4-amino-4,6-dideoxygalactose transaminase